MNILDIGTGYTRCDVCGDGSGYMAVSVESSGYTYEHGSRCHGNLSRNGLTKEQVAELIDENAFLCHTRPAINTRRKFRRDLMSGKWDRYVEAKTEPRLAEAPPTTESPISLERISESMTQVAGSMTQVAQAAGAAWESLPNMEHWETALLEGQSWTVS